MFRQLIAIRSLTLLVALLPALAYAADDWRLDRDDENVRVYTRAVGDSPLREFRAETTAEASVEDILLLMDDTDNFVNWFADCSKARRVEQIDELTAINYLQYDQPWPVSDRDMYVRSEVHIDHGEGKAVIKLRGVPDYKPPNDGLVRIPSLAGSWRFTTREDGKVHIVYQAHADPGGAVPAFLANRAATDAPMETLQNIREQLRK